MAVTGAGLPSDALDDLFARSQAQAAPDPSQVGRSARNHLVGLVTEIVSDRVMSQVELQCGPHRVVSLMSTEAVKEVEGALAKGPRRGPKPEGEELVTEKAA